MPISLVIPVVGALKQQQYRALDVNNYLTSA